jgi:hypothetical protein
MSLLTWRWLGGKKKYSRENSRNAVAFMAVQQGDDEEEDEDEGVHAPAQRGGGTSLAGDRERAESGGRMEEDEESEDDKEEDEEEEEGAALKIVAVELILASRLFRSRARCCCFLCFSQMVRWAAARFSQASTVHRRDESAKSPPLPPAIHP